ncbi:MAG: WYL domain-containing protein, partial [Fulvivirga sp.]
PNQPPMKIKLWADQHTTPYILTKPLHHSQRVISTTAEGVTLTINVQLNFELERELLGFGSGLQVLSPERLRKRMKEHLEKALEAYG